MKAGRDNLALQEYLAFQVQDNLVYRDKQMELQVRGVI